MREEILRILRAGNGAFISGEEISERLGVTRAAVWKHIQALRGEGVEVEAVTRKGYRLLGRAETCPLQEEFLTPLLHTRALGRNMVALPQATSTNAVARQLAREGCPAGTIVTAEAQTAGRGRRGRAWANAPGKDLCLSMVLRPRIETQHAPRFTIATALGVYRLAASLGLAPSIKWPNDVLLGEGLRKISGILLEMEGDLETLDAVIVGLGLNINTDAFPQELSDTATSLAAQLGHTLDRTEVLASLLGELEPVYDACESAQDFARLLSSYRESCGTLGQAVRVAGIQDSLDGVAEDVDELGRLLVRTADGALHTIGAGDVSVRPYKGR